MIELRPDDRAVYAYHAAGHWGRATIGQLIREQIAARSTKVAVKDNRGTRLSYGELGDRAVAWAAALRERGVQRGDVITLHLPNWGETAIAVLAACDIGAVVHPALPTYGPADLAYAVRKCRARVLILPRMFRGVDYRSRLSHLEAERAVPPIVMVLDDHSADILTTNTPWPATDACEARGASADDPFAVIFTSGTESRPKGAVHTHNTILFGERVFAQRLGLTAEDVCFMASPVTHTSGFLHGLILTLTAGATLTLLDTFNGDHAAEQMRADAATWTMGATVFLDETTQALARSGRSLPSLRYFLCGGAPIPEAVVRRAHSVGIQVLPVYGSTESPPHTLMPPGDPIEQAWETDGKPLDAIEVRVVDRQGRQLPTGAVGEEVSRGPNTFIGYLDEPELTHRVLDSEGWYHSGDLATLTESGAVKIVGRLKEMIIRGGQNISVREVEDMLWTYPGVRDVAVVGVPHDRLGECVAAVLVRDAGVEAATLDDIATFLVDRGISKFKIPEWLEIWDALPRTASGKVQKFVIRQRLAAAAKSR